MKDAPENIDDSKAPSNEPNSEISPKSDTPEKQKVRLDPSILIALFAVLISTVSAFISLKESNIMRKQQEILAEQQEASIWPYLDCTTSMTYVDDGMTSKYSFKVLNKGIGPAIIDSVTYRLNGKSINGWSLASELSELYPEAVISALSNQTLDYKVLAPNDEQNVITIKIVTEKDAEITSSQIMNSFDFHLEFCYCSVYGKCWKVKNIDQIESSKECVFRDNIR